MTDDEAQAAASEAFSAHIRAALRNVVAEGGVPAPASPAEPDLAHMFARLRAYRATGDDLRAEQLEQRIREHIAGQPTGEPRMATQADFSAGARQPVPQEADMTDLMRAHIYGVPVSQLPRRPQ